MPKHRFRERIKSYFGSHIDHEKDEELRGANETVEDKVQKILSFLKEEDGRDGKEPLVDLVRDFHTHYQTLYHRYDSLTGYIRNKAHGKKNMQGNSFSSSSDSDSGSDHSSPGKKDSKNGELEIANIEVAELKTKLTSAMEEKEVLQLEYQQALNRLQEAERTIIEITNTVEKKEGERLKVMEDNEDLRLKLEKACELEAELNEKLEEIKQERTGIIFGIEEGKRTIEDLKNVIRQLKDEKETVQGEFSMLQQKVDTSEREITQLNQAQRVAEEENQSLFLKITDLKETLSAKEKDHSVHKEMLESQYNEASSRFKSLEAHIKEVERERDEFIALMKNQEEKERDSSSQIEVLTKKTTNLQLEIEFLLTQKAELEEKLENKSRIISEFSTQIERLKEELENKNADYQRMVDEKENHHLMMKKDRELELDSIRNQKNGLEEQLRGKIQEVVYLQGEKAEMQDKIYELEGAVTVKEHELSFLRKQSEDRECEASSQITSLTVQVTDLQEQLDTFIAQKCESEALYLIEIEKLKGELESKSLDVQRLLDEKDGLVVRVNDLEEEKKFHGEQFHKLEEQMRGEEASFQSRAAEMEKTLNEKEVEILSLQKKLEDVQIGDETHISYLTEEIDKLKKEVDIIETERAKLEIQLENQKTESAQKIADLEIKIKEQEDALQKLVEEHRQLEIVLQESKMSLEVAEMKIGDVTEEFQKNLNSKDQKIQEMEEEIEDLKRDLEMKGDELGSVVENMRTIEVKLRLTNQKLRVTEQLLSEKEDDHSVKAEKLLQNQTNLGEQISSLSRTVTAYKETQQKITADVSDTVSETLSGMDMFSMKFEEDWGHIESRIYEILNELKVTKNLIKETSHEKENLKKENGSLLQQLRDKEESELVLKEKVRTLHKLEENFKALQKTVDEKDKKMGVLERTMGEKDKGITEICEEKREVIRQLCIWIDYHRGRYDHLKETFSKMNTRRLSR
ncbi:unnamed protein product [Cuscuta epithymum]|uniref:NAB domain-containing protein n=2 Tax=Cuscuta epithymum TaxID=186058 RepID=A0AAV0D423_9ASTE|nr:unnamed protein product [Cuscuta epithymum]